MKILVCLKQVPEPETHLRWLPQGQVALAEGARYQMSNQDAQALEWALILAAGQPGGTVQALCLGPARALAVLERARGMGAHAACHLLTPGETDLSALGVARRLAAWAGPKGFDLILCGAQSQDAMRGQVGPLLAGLLGLNWATLAVELRPSGPGRLYVERELESDRRQVLELELPALVSVQSCPGEPRYPSLSNLLRAKAQPPETVELAGLAQEAPQLARLGARRPSRRRAGQTLGGSLPEQAQQLCALLRQQGLMP